MHSARTKTRRMAKRLVGEPCDRLDIHELRRRLVRMFSRLSRTITNLLVLREEVRNLARVEHVIEVLQHGLHHDLGVGEEEGHVLTLHARLDLKKHVFFRSDIKYGRAARERVVRRVCGVSSLRNSCFAVGGWLSRTLRYGPGQFQIGWRNLALKS